jgi:uroporphyrinogen-III decarboxylase
MEILIQSENFRHILGTSNNIHDGTPLSNFQAMMETVVEYSRERGLRNPF